MKNILPRHLVFLGLFLSIFTVMVLELSMNVTVSEETQKMYDYIEALPDSSFIIVSFDHEASSIPEIGPIATVLLKHLYQKGHKLIGISLFSEGTLIGYRFMTKIGKEYNLQYGEDFVYLGFKPQYIAAILSMGESIERTFPQDYLGNDYSSLTMLDSIKNYQDIAVVLSIADGSLTTHWIEYANNRYQIPIIAGVAASMVTTYDPYLNSDQLLSMISGLRGAAEYEQLMNISGGGNRAMPAQTTAHLYVILMIVIGNVIYFRKRKS